MGISGRDYMRERSVLDGSTLGASGDEARPWLTWVLGSVFLLLWLVFAASWGSGMRPQGSAARDVWRHLVFEPGAGAAPGAWWQPFTAMWFHDPVRATHLIISFGLLLLFCPRAERAWGAGRLALVVVGGAIASLLVAWGCVPLVGERGWMVLGPTGGLFGVAMGLAWRGGETYVSYFGRGPWTLRRVAGIALVVAYVFLASTFEGRVLWPILPLTAGHVAGMAVGVVFGRAAVRVPRAGPAAERRFARREVPPEPPLDTTRDRVDGLLAKIADEGMGALTDEERAFLKDASKGYR